METLEKLALSIAFLVILLAGLYESSEISLKAFLILSLSHLFLLFKAVQKVDQLQQEADADQQHDSDDEC